MKKSVWIAGFVVCAVSMVASAAINFTVVVDPVDGGADVPRTIEIYGEFDDGDGGAGLAMFGLNLTISDPNVDLGAILDLDAPVAMASFDRNDGLTNPPGPTNSGYGGTPAGATLLQIGGGQNTIGNTAPPVYPVGTVVEGVATTGAVLLATGTMDVSGLADGAYTLTIDASFANMLDAGQSGPYYSVSPAETTDSSVVLGFIPPPPGVESVTSMAMHGATEYGIQIYPPSMINNRPYNCEPRYGLSENKLVFNFMGEISDASGITVTATNTDNEVVAATVSQDPAGDKLIAIFNPKLANQKIYTIDVAGDAINDFQCEYVVLVGNLTNGGPQANTVNAFDKSLVIARLGGLITDPGNGPHIDIARNGPSAGIINAFDKSIVISRLGNVAE